MAGWEGFLSILAGGKENLILDKYARRKFRIRKIRR